MIQIFLLEDGLSMNDNTNKVSDEMTCQILAFKFPFGKNQLLSIILFYIRIEIMLIS